MNDVEKYIIEHINDRKFKFPKNFNPMEEYSDEFYQKFIDVFEHNHKKKILFKIVKRFTDLLISFIFVVLLSPLFIITSIAITCDSKGPVIFKNRRVGKKAKIFNCWKFRSMATSAPAEVATSAGTTDCYITKVGRFIRKTSIDELPQLFNVLFGKMSIIGYRPLVPTEEKCNNMREKLGVFNMKPGISGFAQIMGRDDVYYKNKALLDAYYVKKASICMDIKIIFGSVAVVLNRNGNGDDKKINKK